MTTGAFARYVVLLLCALALQARAQEPVVRLITMPRDARDAFSRSVSVVRPLDDELLHDWREAKAAAQAARAQVIIFEITAAKGRRDILRGIADDFADLRASGVKVVAFVPEKATGPAALLALEADTLILGADAELGHADPAAMEGTADIDIATARRELRDHALAAARRNGHPELFVEAMIDPDVEIYEVRRTGSPAAFVTARELEGLPLEGTSRDLIDRKGDTLAINAAQAIRFGFPAKSADAHGDLLRAIGLEDRPLSSGEILKLRDRDVGSARWFHLDWSLALLALGILFLILELKTPGIGLNGVLGIGALAAYFLMNAGDGGVDAALTIGLLLVGFLLLLVEVVFLPGFGVPGILGLLLILVSIYAASIGLPGDTLREQLVPDSPGDYDRLQGWLIQFLGSVVAGTLGALLIAPHLHRLPLFSRAYLAPDIARPGQHMTGAPEGSGVSAEGWVKLVVGATGVAETDLRPSGLARIRDRKVDVVTDGEYIARGTRVIVAAIEGHRVVVRVHQP